MTLGSGVLQTCLVRQAGLVGRSLQGVARGFILSVTRHCPCVCVPSLVAAVTCVTGIWLSDRGDTGESLSLGGRERQTTHCIHARDEIANFHASLRLKVDFAVRTQGTGMARSTPWDSCWEGGRDLPSCSQSKEVLAEAHLGCGTCQGLKEPSVYARAQLSSWAARSVEVQGELRGPQLQARARLQRGVAAGSVGSGGRIKMLSSASAPWGSCEELL